MSVEECHAYQVLPPSKHYNVSRGYTVQCACTRSDFSYVTVKLSRLSHVKYRRKCRGKYWKEGAWLALIFVLVAVPCMCAPCLLLNRHMEDEPLISQASIALYELRGVHTPYCASLFLSVSCVCCLCVHKRRSTGVQGRIPRVERTRDTGDPFVFFTLQPNAVGSQSVLLVRSLHAQRS